MDSGVLHISTARQVRVAFDTIEWPGGIDLGRTHALTRILPGSIILTPPDRGIDVPAFLELEIVFRPA